MNLYFIILWIITFINQILYLSTDNSCPYLCYCYNAVATCDIIPTERITYTPYLAVFTMKLNYASFASKRMIFIANLEIVDFRTLQVFDCHRNIKSEMLRLNNRFLKILKISNCSNLENLDDKLINNLPSIKYLYIINVPNLQKFSLNKCHNLKIVRIYNTSIKSFGYSHPFIKCNSLRNLTITKSKIKDLSKNMFKGLDNLLELNMSNNVIDYISSNAFINLPKLQKLILNNNKIKTLSSAASYDLYNLKLLNLNNNPVINYNFLSAISNVQILYSNGTNDRRTSKYQPFDLTVLIPLRYLKVIKLSDQTCVRDKTDLYSLPRPVKIYFSKILKCKDVIYRYPICSINCICKSNKMKCDITINSYLSCVTDLKIFSIELVAYRYRSHEFKALLLCNLKETTELKIRGFHNITKVSEHPFSKLPNLQKLQIIGVNDQLIPDKFIYASRQLNELHLIDLNVRRLTFPIFMKCRLGVLVIKNCPNLKLVDLHLYICINLEILIITHTNITRITDENLLGLSRLRKLDLSRNRIRTIDQYAFTPLNSIQTLILSHNQIKALPFNLFQLNNKLTVLEMEFNLFDRNLDFFKLLRYSNFVNLNYNQMQYLDLDYLIGKTNLTKIGVNSIYCIKNKHKSLYKLNKELIKKFKKFKTCAEFNNKTVIDNNTYKIKNKKRNNPAIGCDISGENIKNALNFTNNTYLLNIILIGISLIAIEGILMILYYRKVQKDTKQISENQLIILRLSNYK